MGISLDEMNIFVPQSVQTWIELKEIANVQNQIITPALSVPIIGIVQDGLLGAYNMTNNKMKIHWKDAMNLMACTSNDFGSIEKNKIYTGSELFSQIIPDKINIKNKKITIINGQIQQNSGVLTKKQLGAKQKNSIIHLVWDQYGINETKNFIDNTQRIINNFNLLNGFSVGIKDVVVTPELHKTIKTLISTEKLKVDHLITEIENNPVLFDSDVFELTILSELSNVISTLSALVMNNLKKDNNFDIMISSGSKGKNINMGQMIAAIGQQPVQGARIAKKLNGRTLSYFHQNDDSAQARGFVSNSYMRGAGPLEFIFHNMASREGLIDTAIKTAESGYVQRKLIKALEDAMVKYDCTVRGANDDIIQYVYGDNGIDTIKQSEHEIKMVSCGNIELGKRYVLSNADLKKFKNYTEADNKKYLNKLIKMRNTLRESYTIFTQNYMSMNELFMLPVNLYRIISNNQTNGTKTTNDLKPQYILDRLDQLLDYNYTQIMCMSKTEGNNPKSIKYKDERQAKTTFEIGLHEYLCPKKCIIDYKLTKKQFDIIIDEILNNFNGAVIQPGEMVGVVAAQSIGEPITQMTLNTFHHIGDVTLGTTNLGMGRAKEILSLSKNIKTPKMMLFLNKEYQQNEQVAKKIASHVKMTTIGDIRDTTEVFFDPNPADKNSIMNKDKVVNVFYSYSSNRLSCKGDVNKMPWVIKITINREKMMDKKVTLLDIKSTFCDYWERRFKDVKKAKKDERVLLENITYCGILSNDDNDPIPTIHIRFDMDEYSYKSISDFVNNIVEDFKLKGLADITKVDGIQKEPLLTFTEDDQSIDMKEQYVIYVSGMNMIDLRYINGIDINKTTCNDIMYVYNTFGIEAARSCLIKELKTVFERAGNSFNFQHLSVLVDLMTHRGLPVSIDRHGMNKTNNGPLAKASFEKTVDQLQCAAVFSETDPMKSVSARIMTGQVVIGGTGMCDTLMDVEMIEKSEYIEDLEVQYKKTFKELSLTTIFGRIDANNKKMSFSPLNI
jgi:DNA-directed RNA polymerase II subunit RPB1